MSPRRSSTRYAEIRRISFCSGVLRDSFLWSERQDDAGTPLTLQRNQRLDDELTSTKTAIAPKLAVPLVASSRHNCSAPESCRRPEPCRSANPHIVRLRNTLRPEPRSPAGCQEQPSDRPTWQSGPLESRFVTRNRTQRVPPHTRNTATVHPIPDYWHVNGTAHMEERFVPSWRRSIKRNSPSSVLLSQHRQHRKLMTKIMP